MEHLCKKCNADISHRKHNALFCEACQTEVQRERDKERMQRARDKERDQKIANGSRGRIDKQESDAERLAALRATSGIRKAALSKTANGIAHRARTQAEIKHQTEREYALRKQAALLPELLRKQGRTVHVRVSSEGMKHLDKESRRTYERGTKAGFKVLPEPTKRELWQPDRTIYYVGFVVR